MLSNRLVIAALGVTCISAAAAGSYLATRQNTADTMAVAPLSASESAAASAPSTALPAEKPVQETEAVVGDVARTSGAADSATTASAPRSTNRRAEVEPPARTARTTTPAAARQDPAPLAQTWPSSANTQPPADVPSVPPSAESAPVPRAEERVAPEPPRAPEPPERVFEELVVSAESVIGFVTENRLSSETARVEDRVEARVTRDVKVGDRVAIPTGSKLSGSVIQVDRGGKFKERARLGVRFHTIVLADGTRVPISTETVFRDGEPPGNSSAAKVGGAAVGGAILGAILGGAKGAAIGGTAGAGAGTAAVIAGDRQAAVLAPGTQMTVRILSPITVTVERE